MAAANRGRAPVRIGVVVGNKMHKTVMVETQSVVRHSKYGKYLRRRARFAAHDEQGCQVGDRVEIVATRPLSKTKRWRVRRIVEKGKQQV